MDSMRLLFLAAVLSTAGCAEEKPCPLPLPINAVTPGGVPYHLPEWGDPAVLEPIIDAQAQGETAFPVLIATEACSITDEHGVPWGGWTDIERRYIYVAYCRPEIFEYYLSHEFRHIWSWRTTGDPDGNHDGICSWEACHDTASCSSR